MFTDAAPTVLSGALKHRCGTRSTRSVNVTGVAGIVDVVVVVDLVVLVVDVVGASVVVVVVVGGAAVVVVGGAVVVVDDDVVVLGTVVVVVGGGAIVGGGVDGGAVGVHSSSDTCTEVAPSVTVTWQLRDWKLGANSRNLPSSSARVPADDSVEVTDTMASGIAPSPSTLSRPSSSSARSTLIEPSAFTGTTSSPAHTPASATPTVISRARLGTGWLIAPPPTTHRGVPRSPIHYACRPERFAPT
jgi:hypothetical protein